MIKLLTRAGLLIVVFSEGFHSAKRGTWHKAVRQPSDSCPRGGLLFIRVCREQNNDAQQRSVMWQPPSHPVTVKSLYYANNLPLNLGKECQLPDG